MVSNNLLHVEFRHWIYDVCNNVLWNVCVCAGNQPNNMDLQFQLILQQEQLPFVVLIHCGSGIAIF